MKKYIFVTGGVVSGIGKGITAASLGRLLKSRGLKVIAQKLDPYINVDPGTISPYQHGEVFVTEDGAETDLDLGHYERFIDENLNKFSNLTAGKAYWNVLRKERAGEYLGETIQIIPHITDEIKRFIYSVGEQSGAEVIITEIGGTTGDLESQPFLEAIRQISFEVPKEDRLFIHVTLVPYIKGSGEYKSKPTQQSVRELRMQGINPDIIVTRCEESIGEEIRDKISLFCNVKPECVIENIDVKSLYHAPLMLEQSHFSDIVCKELNISANPTDLTDWNEMLSKLENRNKKTKIAIVGKYVKLHDAYLSVAEALNHAGFEIESEVKIKWVDSELVTEYSVQDLLSDCDGILVPGGFGNRGIEGKIIAAKFARENNIPYLGICLGMQTATIEFARNVLGFVDADSGEFSKTSENLIIDLMNDQRNVTSKGGTMRLGAYPCVLKNGSVAKKAYNEEEISERHRHRYEFNNNYRQVFEENGMNITGVSPNGLLVEIVEISTHRFYVAVQFHPEFKSRPNRAHPLFKAFLEATIK